MDFFLDNVAGSDANSGTSAGSAVRTTPVGCNLLTTPGDRLFFKKTATQYAPVTTIPTAGQGASAAPKQLLGYDVTPGDGGRATIGGSTYCFNLSGLNFWELRNLALVDATINHVNAAHVLVENCAFQANVNHSSAFVAGGLTQVHGCSFDGPGQTQSATVACISGTGLRLIANVFTNIARPVLRLGVAGVVVWGNRVFNCTTTGAVFDFQNNTTGAVVLHNSSDGVPAGDAVSFTGTTLYQNTVANNVIANVNGAGKAALRAPETFGSWFGRNALFNCVSGYAGGVVSKGGDVALPSLPWVGSGNFAPLLEGAGRLLRTAGLAGFDLGGLGAADDPPAVAPPPVGYPVLVPPPPVAPGAPILELRKAIRRQLAADPVIAKLCANRIRPDRLERGDALPALRLSWSAGDDDEDLAGNTTQRLWRLQVDAYAWTRAEASTLADRVDAVMAATRRQVGQVFIAAGAGPTRQDLYDPPRDAGDRGACRELLTFEFFVST